jgi:hypothetical protein
VCDFRGQTKRNEAFEAGVLGLVDHTHAATAQLLDDAISGTGKSG